MKIEQIRNATLKILYGGQTFLVDPSFQDQGTGFSAETVRPETLGIKSPMNGLPDAPEKLLQGVEVCLVTHVHPDHFTPDALPKDMSIIVQDENDATKVKAMGFEKVLPFEGPEMRIGRVRILQTPAIHGDNAEVVKWMGKGCGYILQAAGEKTLYIAGDTVYCDSVERALAAYRPEVVVLNCCEATIPAGRLIMGPADVEAVCRTAPDAVVIASHLDSVNHALVTSDDVRRFAQEKQLLQVRVPANGEWLEI